MEALTQNQIDEFHKVGAIVVPDRLSSSDLAALHAEIERFMDEARSMEKSNDRLDLEDSHSPETPRVRRIKLPHTISETVRNDDVIAIGVMIDDMAEENGPLMIFPETHKGEIFDHHVNGVFHGAMDLKRDGLDPKDGLTLTGKAGSLSIHHGRVVHGSALNTSNRDRRILFFEMMAADAFPVMGSMTSFGSLEDYNDKMLCGTPSITPRLADVPIRIPLPQPSEKGSIYEIQAGLKNRGFGIYDKS